MKPKAYVVEARNDYEPGRTARVFLREEAAQEFLAAIAAHEKRRPIYPPENDGSPEWDAALDRWFRQDARWHQRHPAGKDCSYVDHFVVVAVELVP